ncbi:M48 family metallopeptidase [Jannaschia sp. W003]|uniref:M48 family metallopeptidase n=1 Tax=Jannaschia sp. W003 TaxID=2867012 RepID=UPI0021A63203|nr:SprT family zinc-dependent metalloprotease [Jannaschia sp. W003]UWQ22120.1 M48 family metallopeptidase [Jannaschia sp. W003]
MDAFEVAGTPVRLRRSARARRMTLRVGRVGGAVTLTLPPRAALADARAFAEGHAAWIARHVAAVPAARTVAVGTTLPVAGREVPVVAGGGRAARWTGTAIAVPDDGHAGRRVATLLKEMARTRLVAATETHAEALGRPFGRITLRDTRSRWGSCSGRGDLMYSWRLAMAPEEVLDYVAAHEVAHLAHMDHSERFWACVARLMPDYAPRRAWLRREGAALHAVRFA